MRQAPRWSGLSIIVLGLTLSMVAFCLQLFGAYIQRVALQPFSCLPTNSMCSLQFWKLLLKLFGAYIEWVALRPFSFLSPNEPNLNSEPQLEWNGGWRTSPRAGVERGLANQT